MIARFLCWFFGHPRGKRVSVDTTTVHDGIATFRCPRCASTWTRTLRKAKAAA